MQVITENKLPQLYIPVTYAFNYSNNRCGWESQSKRYWLETDQNSSDVEEYNDVLCTEPTGRKGYLEVNINDENYAKVEVIR
jgi:hypothetical protein